MSTNDTFAITTTTGDGPELWKTDLSWAEARAEVDQARLEFGGIYRIERQPANPLDLIPDCRT